MPLKSNTPNSTRNESKKKSKCTPNSSKKSSTLSTPKSSKFAWSKMQNSPDPKDLPLPSFANQVSTAHQHQMLTPRNKTKPITAKKSQLKIEKTQSEEIKSKSRTMRTPKKKQFEKTSGDSDKMKLLKSTFSKLINSD